VASAGASDPSTALAAISPPSDAAPSDPNNVDDVYRRCRELGMWLSRQRRMVLDLLWREKSHYQNLEALQSAGVIECLDRASGRLYGYRADPHSHLTCLDTGTIQDLDIQLPDDLLRQIESSTGYAIEAYSLSLSGRPRP
jgi:Fur family transcriptional regulator, ferric uptake regulator